jgi:ATP-binding cassette, subfamily G (WHITE), member 2, SNQ2
VSRQFRGDVQYCPEDDIHFPTLTVNQTLGFAAKTRAPQSRVENLSRSQYTRKVTEIYSTIFGLNHVKDTPVGDAAIRGVSGGEKKRVSYVSFHFIAHFTFFFDVTFTGLVKPWLREV